jgi:hypothetical protein
MISSSIIIYTILIFKLFWLSLKNMLLFDMSFHHIQDFYYVVQLFIDPSSGKEFFRETIFYVLLNCKHCFYLSLTNL